MAGHTKWAVFYAAYLDLPGIFRRPISTTKIGALKGRFLIKIK